MADLSEFQIKWLGDAHGAPIDKAALKKADRMATARQNKLNVLLGEDSDFAAGRTSIIEAQQFSISIQGEMMKWRASDSDMIDAKRKVRADVEIDTFHDLVSLEEEIPDEIIANLNIALDRLMAASERMAAAYDEEGNRMFSDDDIRREIWAPMVREGSIPDNLVPKQFSEEALAFRGAADIYQARIDEYSQNSTGYEGTLRAIGIALDTAQLVTTLASSSVSIAGATTIASCNEQIATGKDANGAVLSDAQIADLKAERMELQQREAYTKLAGVALTSGVEMTQLAAEQKASDDGLEALRIIDKAASIFIKLVAAGAGPIANSVIGINDISGASGQSQKVAAAAELRMASSIQASIIVAVAELKVGMSLVSIYRADPKKRDALVEALVGNIADAVQQAWISAASTESNKQTQADMRKAGVVVRTAIVTAANIGQAVDLISNGEKPGEIALRIGAAAFQGAGGALSDLLVDAMRKDSSATDMQNADIQNRAFMEKTTNADGTSYEAAAELARAKAMEKFQQTLASITHDAMNAELALIDAADAVTEIGAEDSATALAVQKKVEEAQQEKAIAELTEAFGDPAVVTEMFDDFESKMPDYDELYENATPSKLVEWEPDAVADALKTLDEAIARTSQLRARAEMINAITSGGAGLVAALVPGTGAVIAAQAVAYDIFCLTQSVRIHNEWVESMEVAFRAGSAYSSAVEKTLENAKITLSHHSVKVALDSLKLGSEIGRCFDSTGATTIVSASLTMTSALVDFGYKMRKEDEIRFGWNAYKDAIENPQDRKLAREALRLNSTLAKCCIAYGACIAKDPAAQEAIRISGMTPEMLADNKEVCQKLVDYLETKLSDDPVVMHVERQPKSWQPGKPELTPKSWFETKTAATISCEPHLDKKDADTPGMDRLLIQLHASDCWDGLASYNQWRQNRASKGADADKRRAVAEKTIPILEKIIAQMKAYQPMQAGVQESHDEMEDIALTYKSLAEINIRIAKTDIPAN